MLLIYQQHFFFFIAIFPLNLLSGFFMKMNYFYNDNIKKSRLILSSCFLACRKVRTPKSIIADNIRPARAEDQCNRKQVQFGCSETR